MSIKNFSIPTSTAVFTSTHVVQDKQPVLCVSHSMDGEWMFQCGNHGFSAKSALVVALGNMLHLDRTLEEVSDLPLHHIATRAYVGDTWTYREKPTAVLNHSSKAF